MNGVIKGFKQVQNVLEIISAVALLLMMLIVGLQTFTRYVIFYSLPWSEEASRYLFVLMVLMGINVGISQNLMVRIDLIDSFIKGKAQTALAFGRDVLCLVVAVIYTYSTFGMISIGKFQKSPAMQIPMNYMYTILLIGFAIAILSFVFQIYERYFMPQEVVEE